MSMTSTISPLPHATTTAAPTAPVESELPATFETALKKMLQAFGDGRDPSLSAIAGAALILLQNAEQSLATIAAASDKTKDRVVVNVPLKAEVQDLLASGLKETISNEDVASISQRQAETENSVAGLGGELDRLRARHEELSEKVQELAGTVQRDHRKLMDEHAVLIQRIEVIEMPRKPKSS
jgi:hypothetical protein